MNYFITAIGTDSGKTLISALICKALGADYWKPIQAGYPTDSDVIRNLAPEIKVHKEACSLKKPASPHDAANEENIIISVNDFQIPKTDKDLVIEGAGGLLVPINQYEVIADLIPKFNAEVILVSNLYLGSINHTLLSFEELKRRNVKVKGIIFNGESNPASEDIILKKSSLPCLLKLPGLTQVTQDSLSNYVEILKQNWNELEN